MTETPTDKKLSETLIAGLRHALSLHEDGSPGAWRRAISGRIAELESRPDHVTTDNATTERKIGRNKLVYNKATHTIDKVRLSETHPSAIREAVEGEREGKHAPREAIPVPQLATVPCLWDDQSRQFVAVYSIRGVEIAAAIRARGEE